MPAASKWSMCVGCTYRSEEFPKRLVRVQELCESRGGRPELSVLMGLTVSVDVKQHRSMLRLWSQFAPNHLRNGVFLKFILSVELF